MEFSKRTCPRQLTMNAFFVLPLFAKLRILHLFLLASRLRGIALAVTEV